LISYPALCMGPRRRLDFRRGKTYLTTYIVLCINEADRRERQEAEVPLPYAALAITRTGVTDVVEISNIMEPLLAENGSHELRAKLWVFAGIS
jgi:hypothetical protein